MYTAVANSQDVSFKPYITVSTILHAALILLLSLSAYFHWARGSQWTSAGGGGENVNVKLVGSEGIPMPRPKVAESQVVDPTKSLYKPEEAPKIPDPTPVPGHGGAPAIPTGVNENPGSSSGLAVKGQGGGDFASRYGWYIESVKRRIQTNWLQNTIDPALRAGHTAKTTVQFTITREGTVKDITISQPSGNLSMDNSGLRAIMASNPMPALPTDYSGSYVTVLFDFDLSMTR